MKISLSLAQFATFVSLSSARDPDEWTVLISTEDRVPYPNGKYYCLKPEEIKEGAHIKIDLCVGALDDEGASSQLWDQSPFNIYGVYASFLDNELCLGYPTKGKKSKKGTMRLVKCKLDNGKVNPYAKTIQGDESTRIHFFTNDGTKVIEVKKGEVTSEGPEGVNLSKYINGDVIAAKGKEIPRDEVDDSWEDEHQEWEIWWPFWSGNEDNFPNASDETYVPTYDMTATPSPSTTCNSNEIEVSGYGCLVRTDRNGEDMVFVLNPKKTTLAKHASKAKKCGGNLASILSEDEDILHDSYSWESDLAYIGLLRNEKDEWEWSDNSDFSYTNWADGEPNNCGGNENYGTLWRGGEWNDHPGEDKHEGFYLLKPDFINNDKCGKI